MVEALQRSEVILKELRFEPGPPESNPDFAKPDLQTHIDPAIREKFPDHSFRTIPSNQYELLDDALRQLKRKTYKSGGTGLVLPGFDRKMLRPVVFKTLLPGFAGAEKNTELIHQEARYLARLPNNPGLVRVYDLLVLDIYGEEFPAIAMEKLEELPDQLPLEEVMQMGEQIGSALDDLHKIGVHYDVKDTNIMRRSDGHFVLTDFGFSYLNDPRFTFDTTAQSMVFSDPTQRRNPNLRDNEKDPLRHMHQTDQYGLAMSMFTFLTGTVPYVTERDFLPVPPTGDFPYNLINIFRKALDWDRAERFPTCSEFVVELNTELRRLKEEGETSTLLTVSKLRRLARSFEYTLLSE